MLANCKCKQQYSKGNWRSREKGVEGRRDLWEVGEGSEGGGGGFGITEVHETSGECGSFLRWQCSIHPSELVCRRTADVPG